LSNFINDSSAFECYQFSVSPIVEKIENIAILKQLEPTKKLTLFYKLVETIWIFKKSINVEPILSSYVNVCLRSLDHTLIKQLLEMLLNIDLIYSSPSIINIYSLYCNHQRDKLKEPPKFSWIMPHASIPGHSGLESFLRSEQQRIFYPGNFLFYLF
jgi:hypothetical protein